MSPTLMLTSALLVSASFNLGAQVPPIVTYQGRVQVNATNFTGAGQFKFALVDVGTNAARLATATATVVNGFIVAVTPTDGGSGYVTAPTVTITDPSGSNAVVTANVTGGAVVSFDILHNGRDYSATPTVTLTPPPPAVAYVTYWSNDGTSTGGNEPANAVTANVSQGLFTVVLGDTNLANMTAVPWTVFLNPAVYLRLWFNDGVQGFQQLTPEQRVGSVGYAMVAESLSAALSSAGLSGTYSNAVCFVNVANSYSGNGAGLTSLNAAQLTTGTVPDSALGNAWKTGGNAGTTPGAHFLGTTDNQALELRVNNLRGLRLEANSSNSVNVVAGSSRNAVGTGAVGATIGGGGALNYGGSPYTNRVDADFGTVAGGMQNVIQADARFASVGGGEFNAVQNYAQNAVIAGGAGNTILLGADCASIGGGSNNRIEPEADYATLAGGFNNRIATNSDYAVIGGGYNNGIATNSASATIAGGQGNEIEVTSANGTIGGGYYNGIAANSASATIAGGYGNDIGANAESSAIGGGYDNNIADSGRATIAGGWGNNIAAGSSYATIAGGSLHRIGTTSLNSVIGGGNGNLIAADSGSATIAGGANNNIRASSSFAVIGGGNNNSIAAKAEDATIAGGTLNDIGTNADYSIIGGGFDNNIAADSGTATIAGGQANNIGTNSYQSTIGGGYNNNISANALFATIPGGRANAATNYAFAAGYRAKANHTGAFVWGDSYNADVASTNADSVTMRASGGYRLFANSGATVGVYLAPGGGSWTSMSDRHAKENLQAVDARAVLARMATLPLATWNYKSQDAAIRHIGPMAQDFHAAFGLGETDTGITTVDADGVALAAIQGLNQKVETANAALRSELRAKDAELQALKTSVAELQEAVCRLTQTAK